MTTTAKRLTCSQCASRCGIAKDVEGCIDWGLAVIDEEGVVRPQHSEPEGITAAVRTLRVCAVCDSPECRYQRTLRRRFDPSGV